MCRGLQYLRIQSIRRRIIWRSITAWCTSNDCMSLKTIFHWSNSFSFCPNYFVSEKHISFLTNFFSFLTNVFDFWQNFFEFYKSIIPFLSRTTTFAFQYFKRLIRLIRFHSLDPLSIVIQVFDKCTVIPFGMGLRTSEGRRSTWMVSSQWSWLLTAQRPIQRVTKLEHTT